MEFLLPLVPVKKLSTAERMKKEREPLSFSGLIVQKYEATTYKNDVVFWQDFYASTDSFSKVTLKHLRSLREKFVCDVRLDRVGTVNLYKLFVWDHVDSKGYLLNDEYCFEVFGLSGLKLGLTKNEILNAKNRR